MIPVIIREVIELHKEKVAIEMTNEKRSTFLADALPLSVPATREIAWTGHNTTQSRSRPEHSNYEQCKTVWPNSFSLFIGI